MILKTKKKCFSYLGGAAFPGTMRAKQATNKKNMVITKRDIFFLVCLVGFACCLVVN